MAERFRVTYCVLCPGGKIELRTITTIFTLPGDPFVVLERIYALLSCGNQKPRVKRISDAPHPNISGDDDYSQSALLTAADD